MQPKRKLDDVASDARKEPRLMNKQPKRGCIIDSDGDLRLAVEETYSTGIRVSALSNPLLSLRQEVMLGYIYNEDIV